jgi:serine/threonine-protein kinase
MTERDLFIAALQIEDPTGRSAYLDKACAADAELRQRLEALLKAFVQAGSFLQQPAVCPAATSDVPPVGPPPNNASTEAAGTVIGPYKLLQQLGEGGMGTVWLAEQTQPVQRKVALKLIRSGMASQQVLARFEAERQALALMDHPNIAKVLDAGTTEGGQPLLRHGVGPGRPHHAVLRQDGVDAEAAPGAVRAGLPGGAACPPEGHHPP